MQQEFKDAHIDMTLEIDSFKFQMQVFTAKIWLKNFQFVCKMDKIFTEAAAQKLRLQS